MPMILLNKNKIQINKLEEVINLKIPLAKTYHFNISKKKKTIKKEDNPST